MDNLAGRAVLQACSSLLRHRVEDITAGRAARSTASKTEVSARVCSSRLVHSKRRCSSWLPGRAWLLSPFVYALNAAARGLAAL